MNHIYVYQAIRRTKENSTTSGPRVIREPDVHEDTVGVLKKAIQGYPGTWRIYRSVNLRDVRKAEIELAKTLIDRAYAPQDGQKNVLSLWKTILMQPRNKAERLYLVDIDTTDDEKALEIVDIVVELAGHGETVQTPNGWHFLCKPFDVRVLEQFDCASVHKDGLLFVERIEVT